MELKVYPKPQVKRETGEWWLDAGRWSLHLDAVTFARFQPNPDVTVRRTLTWLLGKLRRTEEPSREALLSRWFEELLEQTQVEPAQLVMKNGPFHLPDANWADHYTSGWFALITPQYPMTVSLAERVELRQNIVEVLESYLDEGIIGWLNTHDSSEHLLLYVAEQTLQNNADWSDPLEDSAMGPMESHGPIRIFAEEVLDALTQDVLLSCDLLVGNYFAGVQEMPESLLTLALLRAKDTEVRTKKLTIWGESPLHILLHTVPKRGVDWFLDAVQSRLRAAGSSAGLATYTVVNELPEELLISLRGIVEANLNVSEAARDLFIHRNTLIHRLDRLKEFTGYDARVFQDALILWLAYLATQSGGTNTD